MFRHMLQRVPCQSCGVSGRALRGVRAAMGRHEKSCRNDAGRTERCASAPVFGAHLKNRAPNGLLAAFFSARTN